MYSLGPSCFYGKMFLFGSAINGKYVYYSPKKRDFLRVKSHYWKHVFAPMIVMKSYHRGFYIPVAERS